MHLPLLVMKRGIIHLCKIGILFLNRDFEHDVYELIKAFYPEAEISILFMKKTEEEYDLFLYCEKDNDSFIIKYEKGQRICRNRKQSNRGADGDF